MKLQLISYDNLDMIKTNLPSIVELFKRESSSCLEEELGIKLLADTRFDEVADFTLDMSQKKTFLTDAENARRVYGNLRFLSESQASDERLWAGLCYGVFWKYVKYRWEIDKRCTARNIAQHFMFGYGARRSLTRNALSRLWWIGRLTYDEKRSDHWELTRLVCENPDNIMHTLERNTSNNPVIIRAFLSAVIAARKDGIPINTNVIGELSKYLNLLGGIYVLDCLPQQKIFKKIYDKAVALGNGSK